MTTAASSQCSNPMAQRQIINIMQEEIIMSKDVAKHLDCASEAFDAKSFKKAAKSFTDALHLLLFNDDKHHSQIILLIRYMLCMCWLQTEDAKDLLEAETNLSELVEICGHDYPMFYYALGNAYFKLYRFKEADEILEKGFAVLNGRNNIVEYDVPGTNNVIPESSRRRLMDALVSLRVQCSTFHWPDAVCCMPDCSSHSQKEGADNNIFFESPTFAGIVRVTCDNVTQSCVIYFHTSCWKSKKEQLSSLTKLSDKELLSRKCFTPNCKNEGVRCVVKKIEIYDENNKLKTCCEFRSDDIGRHAKSTSTSKGAVRKQQQTPKKKVPPAKCRPTVNEGPGRSASVSNSGPPNQDTWTKRKKNYDNNEEDDDFHDEKLLNAGIKKLEQLRAKNFNISNDAMWRPNLPMYGNEFMLETGKLIDDPDFTDEGLEDTELKKFVFSYFSEFISINGAVKIDDLTLMWNKQKKLLFPNCARILKHYLDHTEFMLQSLKFVVVGDYICNAENLPKAYDSVKNKTCESVRLFASNDIDQRSNSSSIDGETVYNEILDQQNNNDSSMNLSACRETEVLSSKSIIDSKNDRENIGKTEDEKKVSISSPMISHDIQNTQRKEHNNPTKVSERRVPADEKNMTLKKYEINPGQTPEIAIPTESVEPIVGNNYENPYGLSVKVDQSQLLSAQPAYEVGNIMQPFEIKFNVDLSEKKFMKQSKCINDLKGFRLDDDCNQLIRNGSETDTKPIKSKCPLTSGEQNYVKNFSDPLDNWTEPESNNNELKKYKEKSKQLESELEHVKKTFAEERIKMLQINLNSQYQSSQNTIMGKIAECRKNRELFTVVQSMLINSIGEKMLTSEEEWSKTILELEKILKIHQKKLEKMTDQVQASKALDNRLDEIYFEPETIPNMPSMKMIDIVRTAFGIYENHNKKLEQKLERDRKYFKDNNPMIYTGQPYLEGHPISFGTTPDFVSTSFRVREPHEVSPIQSISLESSKPCGLVNLQQNFSKCIQQNVSSNIETIPNVSSIGPLVNFICPERPDLAVPIKTNPSSFPDTASGNSSKFTEQTARSAVPSVNFPTVHRDSVAELKKMFSSQLSTEQNHHKCSNLFVNQQSSKEKNVATVSNSPLTDDASNIIRSSSAASNLDEPCKKITHSIDKLLRKMRVRYNGILELDLVKAVEYVRGRHNNSLSGLAMSQIIREADKYIVPRQFRQLFPYSIRPTSGPFGGSFNWDCDGRNSGFSPVPGNTGRKDPQERSSCRKTWKPVDKTNSGWTRNDQDHPDCTICLEPTLVADSCNLQCGHRYHTECIKAWHERRRSCPICQQHSITEEEYPALG